MILLSIRNLVEDFAQRYGLNTWDWITFAITLTTLVVSSCALGVARKTLKSQKKTEKNTKPIMNTEIQLSLMGNILLELLDAYLFLFALAFFLEKKTYKAKPSPHFWNRTHLSLDSINVSLFYNDNDKFIAFNNLKVLLEEFNYNLTSLQTTINSPNSNKNIIEFELNHIFRNSVMILKSYCDVLKACYGKNQEDIKLFIDENFLSVNYPLFVRIAIANMDIDNKEDVSFYYIKNSEVKTILKKQIDLFTDSINQLHFFDREYIVSKMDILMRFVDVIIMNVPCDGGIESILSLDISPENGDTQNKAHLFRYKDWSYSPTSKKWFSKSDKDSLEHTNIDLSSANWLFYVTTY